MTAPQAVQRLSRFSLTTADAERVAAFYESAFGCRRLSTARLSGPVFETLMGVQGGALRNTLRLGEQIIELLKFDRRGKDYPEDAPVSDLTFQHFAIVVSDMAEAYGRLLAIKGWTAISRGGPKRLPASSGGVTAFKFRDPEGHPLELLCFPKGAAPAYWREMQDDGVFLGIDHSAICVSETARSVSFYENLGFHTSSRSLNRGAEQEKLDNVEGAKVEVTALTPFKSGPHLELLCYHDIPHNRETPHGNADIATARLVFEASDCPTPREIIDPDGHHLIMEGQTVSEALAGG